MQLSILFWVYHRLELCEARLELLRHLNPDVPIYVLYGGDPADAVAFRSRFARFSDDFYAFDEARPGSWKWRHGDRMLAHWYEKRGQALPWDSVFVVQWDLLTLSPAARLLPALEAEQLMLPGLRPIASVNGWWAWVRPGSPEGAEYESFMAARRADGGLPADPLCCQFLAAVLPRSFLARYAAIEDPELGFLEYKIPIYAQLWGYSFARSHPFNPVWFDEPKIRGSRDRPWRRLLDTMHAEAYPVSPKAVRLHAAWPWGRRVFHPFADPFPIADLPAKLNIQIRRRDAVDAAPRCVPPLPPSQ